jgi:hypothetical protein
MHDEPTKEAGVATAISMLDRKLKGGVRSAQRIEYAEETATAARACETRIREVEGAISAAERERARLTIEWREVPVPRPEFSFWPTRESGQARARHSAGLDSELRMLLDQLAMLRRQAADAALQAEPLSDGAAARLRRLVDDLTADAELRQKGIDPTHASTPAGREHLLAIAATYGIAGA